MELKTIKRTVFEVDYTDLEEFINEVYDVDDYSIPASEEVGNDTTLSQEVEKEKPLNNEDKVTKFTGGNGNAQWILDDLMTDMCNRGLIEEGYYNINICY